MLKLTPRTITGAILTIFLAVVFLQQFSDYLGNTRPQNKTDENLLDQVMAYTRPLHWIDRVDYDLHLQYHDAGRKHPDVAVVEIGERSLVDLGYFPFSRSIYKKLIEKLEAAGVKVIGFDITFSERERNALEQLRAFREDLIQHQGFDSLSVKMLDERIFAVDADEDFGNALAKTKLPVMLGWSFADEDRSGKLSLTPSGDVLKAFAHFQIKPRQRGVTRLDKNGKELPLVSTVETMSGRRPVANIPDLMNALNPLSSIGLFLPAVDPDSVIRRVPLMVEYNQQILGALALHAVAAYHGEEPTYHFEDGQLAVRGIKRGEGGAASDGQLYAPLTPRGNMLARFYGGARAFSYTEFSDIILGRISDSDLKQALGGKIVFVGVTAVGLKDIRATPFASDYPGVEVHATIASNILQRSFMVKDWRYFWIGCALILAFGLCTSFAVFRFRPAASFATTFLLMAIIQVGTHSFLFNRGVVVPTLLPSIACFMVFFSGILFRYFTEEREKKMVRTAFSRYVSGAVVEEILKDQTKLRLGGQKKELTVMFVDLVGFTKISEHMDVGLVTQLLNEYFTRMTDIVLANQGTLDKYMGDGIMCFWGAPLDIPAHAELACKTALEMQAELAKINAEWKSKHGISIENRIGVHTGDMAVGNMGSTQVFSYTVMGDNVNLASRLEGVNTVYGTRVVVSATTASRAGSGFLLRPLDKVQVKGKEDSVEILELVGAREAKEPEWVHAFRTGLKHYQAGEWDDAESAFGACLTLKPGDGPSQVFVDRIRDFRLVEPEEWKGIWKLSSK
jgi:adenylate cyclase